MKNDKRDNITSYKRDDTRIENSIRNIMSSIVLVAFGVVMPFAIRTLMISSIGEDYLGLSSLFMSVMMILNVSEMGIGSVMVYFLYTPAAQNDIDKIDEYMKTLHDIYIGIGITVLAIGFVLTPFIGHFITGNIPNDANITLSFIIYLVGSAIQYFIYPEEASLFEAFQRKDLTNWIMLVSDTISYILQIIALCVFHNFILYLGTVAVRSIIAGIMRKIFGRRYFPEYKSKGDLMPEEKKKIRTKVISMIGHQIDEQLFNSIDTVFISAIVGLTAVTLYSNYYCIVTAVSMFSASVFKAVLPSVGNAVAIETVENNYRRFLNVFWLGSCFTGCTTTCMICLYQNFMVLWMGEDRILGMDMVILFCLYSYLSQIRRTVTMFKDAAGMWWNDRYKPYISMVVDLMLDAVLIHLIGIKGAIISSIFCLAIIEIPWETKVLFKEYFKKSPKTYTLRMIVYGIINVSVVCLLFVISDHFVKGASLWSLLLRVFICMLSIPFYYMVYSKTSEFHTWKDKFGDYLSAHR